MICIVKDSSVIVGPLSFTESAWLSSLFLVGFYQTGDVLRGPDGSLVQMPTVEPTSPYGLGAGYIIAPVVYSPATPPPGQQVTGHSVAYTNGFVTVTLVYGNAPAASPTTLTAYSFLNRFTDEESVAIEIASASDPVIRVAERKLGLIKDWNVDLTDQGVIQYVGYLESKALLTAARAAAILTP